MGKLQVVLTVILISCLLGQPGWATRAYLTDSFKVKLRTGRSIENRIIGKPSPGQCVEILNSNGEILGSKKGPFV